MRGESGRSNRASGGSALKKQASKNVVREAKGSHPHNEPDDATSRGDSPIFRAKGGRAKKFADGGALKRAFGGATIGGGGKKPSAGRAARARGGGVGADLHPKTHEGGSGPKGRKIMSDSEKEPEDCN
jgi:hypothetical protein